MLYRIFSNYLSIRCYSTFCLASRINLLACSWLIPNLLTRDSGCSFASSSTLCIPKLDNKIEHIESDAKFLSDVSFKFRDLEAMERLLEEGWGVHIDVGMLKPSVFLDHSTRGDRLLRRVYAHTLILPRLMQCRSKCRDVSNHIDEPSHPRLLYQRPLS